MKGDSRSLDYSPHRVIQGYMFQSLLKMCRYLSQGLGMQWKMETTIEEGSGSWSSRQ